MTKPKEDAALQKTTEELILDTFSTKKTQSVDMIAKAVPHRARDTIIERLSVLVRTNQLHRIRHGIYELSSPRLTPPSARHP